MFPYGFNESSEPLGVNVGKGTPNRSLLWVSPGEDLLSVEVLFGCSTDVVMNKSWG